jgi:hypothetical protein
MNNTQLTSQAVTQLSIVDIRPYTAFLTDLYELANKSDISTIWISSSASQAVFSRIPTQKRLISSKFYSFVCKNNNKKSFRFTS